MKEPNTEDILYDGKVKLYFNKTGHKYTVDNKVVFGVTSITKVINNPALMYWAVNKTIEFAENNLKVGEVLDEVKKAKLLNSMKSAHRKISTDATTIGEIVHKWLEKYVNAKIKKTEPPKIPINEKVKNCIVQFLKWEKANKVKWLSSERKVYSVKYEYAGTLDAEAIVNGELSVIDFKTSSGIYMDYFLQNTAYIKAREEESGKKYDKAWILRIPKDGSDFEAKSSDAIKEFFEAFLNCLNLYRFQMKMKGQAILEKANKQTKLNPIKKQISIDTIKKE